MQIYERIYEVVAENFKEAEKTFVYQKETFLCDVQSHPQVVDVSKYLELPNPQFFQAIYVGVYKRLPEGRTAVKWEKIFCIPQKKFQESLLKAVANSTVTAINHIRFTNNPYFEQRRGMRYRMLGMLYGLTDKSSLRKFGKKMPKPIQQIIRKVFL